MANHTVVGRVVSLFRYPVKSMAAQVLDEVDVSWEGLAGDRRWAFIQAGHECSGFPWLTVRELPLMWKYRPSFVDPLRPDKSPTMVRTPAGSEFDVVDPELAAELGPGVRVIKQERGVFDAFPLSLISTRTVADLGETVGDDLDPMRFRPNLVIEPIDNTPFPEDAWVGWVLRVGDMRMRVDKRDQRCIMINVDPRTTERNPAVLRALGGDRQACLGVYGSTVTPGRVAVGDAVAIEG
ncbi:MAG TPA: MOSC domain-containing protein [Acidothermaceae bacterium]|nr:MOSC domain-containing protein [Acidothermaceae bacterium]